MLQLTWDTPDEWIGVVLSNFDAFVIDHALCERKASALGLSLIAKYPDKTKLIDPLLEFAKEELEHFHVMMRILMSRGLTLASDARDDYVHQLKRHLSSAPEQLLLDRLLLAGLIEARSCERLMRVSLALPPGALKDTYLTLTQAEARHHALFTRLAEEYYPRAIVQQRAVELLRVEGQVAASMPLRAAVH